MCRHLTLFAICIFLTSCGGQTDDPVTSNNQPNTPGPTTPANNDNSSNNTAPKTPPIEKVEFPELVFATPSGEPDVDEPIDAESQATLRNKYKKDSHPQLLLLLSHRNPQVRLATAKALFRLKSDVDLASGLVKLVLDPNVEIRKAASGTLKYSGDLTAENVKQMIPSLNDPDEDVAKNVAEVIGAQAERSANAVPYLVALLESDERAKDAMVALGNIGPTANRAASAVAPKLKVLKYNLVAIQTLGKIGADDELLSWWEANKKGNGYMEGNVLSALSAVRPTNERIYGIIEQALAKHLEKYRQTKPELDLPLESAMSAFAKCQPAPEKTVEKLNELIESGDKYLRQNAIYSMAFVRPRHKSIIPHVIATFESNDEYEQEQTFALVSDFDENLQPLLEAILAAYVKCDEDNTKMSVTLEQTYREKGLPIYLDIANNSTNEDIRVGALGVLYTISGYGATAENKAKVNEAFKEIVNTETNPPSVRSRAASNLTSRRVKLDGFDSLLIAGLKSKHITVRYEAANALAKIGGDAAEAALLEALNDENDLVIRNAAYAIGELRVASAVPALTKLLEEGPATTHKNIAWALNKIGEDAKSAVPAIEKLLESDDGETKEAAKKAILKLDPEKAKELGIE